MATSVAVVGAGLGGLRVCESLRRGGFTGPLTLVGAEPHLPYDRPPLSKGVLMGSRSTDDVALRGDALDDGAAYEELTLDLRLGCRAVALTPHGTRPGGRLELEGGDGIDADAVVLATGAVPRHLPDVPISLAGVHVLRTIGDSLGIRADLEKGPRPVAVIGGGFIGAEVAASAREVGCQVTILEALPVPLSRVLGETMGRALAGLHTDHGVTVHTSVRVDGVTEQAGSVTGVAIEHAGGRREEVPADVVVVGIGARPATDWLEGSGLDVDDGVRCDAGLRAAAGIWAVGDIARWPNERYGEEMRTEHWTHAVESAMHVAEAILAGPDAAPVPFAPVPYVWSDQYEAKILHVGRNRADDRVEVLTGTVEERRFVAGYERDGRLMAALSISDPRRLMRFRALLARTGGASWSEATALADEIA